MKQILIALFISVISAFAAGPNPLPNAQLSGSSSTSGTLNNTGLIIGGTMNPSVLQVGGTDASGLFDPLGAAAAAQNAAITSAASLYLLKTGTIPATQVSGLPEIGYTLKNVTPKPCGLPRLNAKLVASGTQQFRIGVCGDSYMQNAYGKFDAEITNRLGLAGYHLSNANLTGSAAMIEGDFSHWITGVTYNIGPGDTAAFLAVTGLPFVQDTVHYYVCTSASAGSVKLQYSLSGTGTWTDFVGTTSCVSGSEGAMVISGTLARNSYQTRVVGVTGTTKIINALAWDSTARGAILEEFARGGIVDAQFGSAVLPSIWNTVVGDLAPDVLVWKSAVVPSLLQANTEPFFARFNNLKPADWVIVTPHPESDPTLDAQYVSNNTYLREIANTYNYVLFDSYSLFGSAANVVSNFGAYDTVHLPGTADAYWVSTLFSSGLFNGGGRWMPISSLTGTIASSQLPTNRIISDFNTGLTTTSYASYKNIICSSSNSRAWNYFNDTETGATRFAITKYAHTEPYYPDALEFVHFTSPYAVTLWHKQGLWVSASGARPTSTPPAGLYLDGAMTITGTASVPSNTTTPVTWWTVTVNGVGTFKVPLYQ